MKRNVGLLSMTVVPFLGLAATEAHAAPRAAMAQSAPQAKQGQQGPAPGTVRPQPTVQPRRNGVPPAGVVPGNERNGVPPARNGIPGSERNGVPGQK